MRTVSLQFLIEKIPRSFLSPMYRFLPPQQLCSRSPALSFPLQTPRVPAAHAPAHPSPKLCVARHAPTDATRLHPRMSLTLISQPARRPCYRGQPPIRAPLSCRWKSSARIETVTSRLSLLFMELAHNGWLKMTTSADRASTALDSALVTMSCARSDRSTDAESALGPRCPRPSNSKNALSPSLQSPKK